ncbi:MAG: glycoside hydrolase family 2 TIM barrel-domain containing protein [Opitutae bacterium]|nr:glycoside hydrolase family 2 TIM barrel-domain containing protein [Opitutae bacterium]MDG2345789.1 glycoside hydrolase family 2 TIM barrel-domain containing protein [Opitutae bacterium]
MHLFNLRSLVLGALTCIALANTIQAYTPEYSTAGFYQTDSSLREAINFNVGWRFIKRDIAGAEATHFDDQDWTLVNLPNGMELLPLCASGGVNYQGPSWYRKQFTIDAALKGRKVMLHFESIMGKSKIWLNGTLLKENFGSYFPIHIDLSEHLNYGTENIIAVRADNSNDPNFPPGKDQETLDFTYFGGIYRDAWLITHNTTYVTHPLAVDKVAGGGVFVHYEDLSEASARVLVDTDIANEGTAKIVHLRLELKDKDGHVVATHSSPVSLPTNGSNTASLEMTVKKPKLWRPDSPHLYDLFVTIQSASGQPLDSFRKRIGLRTIEMRGQDGFYLNGKPYPQVLMGANRHQDFPHIGHALPNNLHYRDALKLRQTGMRVIRSAHYIQDPAFMDACDELGLFMVAAIPGWQFWNDQPIFMDRMLQDVRNMVYGQANAPQSPEYSTHTCEGESTLITFDHVGSGLTTGKALLEDTVYDADDVLGFIVMDAKGKYQRARGKIVAPNQVRVNHPGITQPKSIRYGWENFPDANLFGEAKMPAFPFRTDAFSSHK